MWNWVEKLSELQAKESPMVLVTVTGSRGSAPREVGAKMIVLADGTIFGTIGGGAVEHWVIAEAQKCLTDGATRTADCDLGKDLKMPCGGQMSFLMEVFHRRPGLYVFGGGHVGQAVCRVLTDTPFAVHVIDERAEWICADRFPPGVIRHHKAWAAFVNAARWDGQWTYVAILTHEAELDQKILKEVLRKPARYVGMIGSRAKWEKMKGDLAADGVPKKDLERVHCPLGLASVKGKSPQEIAVSLAAEILSIHDGK
ncbi:MAG: xanthine dehydrogenase accessory protein XdhC [Pseudomonadota bacterium]